MPAVCGYPVKPTWLKAIKVGNYVRWPVLTECNIQKYYPKTTKTAKGHLNQTRKNVGSTKVKATPLETWDTSHLHGKKVRIVYTQTYMVGKTMFSNQTGQLPIRSLCGNKHIRVMVEIDSNAILVEPMKNRKYAKMIRAYNAFLLQLKRVNIIPKKHVIDNKVSENMKNNICDTCKLDMELVPPGCHRHNAAEVTIHNFKAHFLGILASVGNSFPPNLWDQLLSQTQITINLIQQSNATPNVLAYAHISKPFDYKKSHSLQCDVRPRYMRKPTNAAHGHIIRPTDGISSHHQNIITHTIVISSTPRVNDYPTQSNFNTNSSPIHPSHTPTK
jgi:hypothetical protein